jgi:hypothetical protein
VLPEFDGGAIARDTDHFDVFESTSMLPGLVRRWLRSSSQALRFRALGGSKSRHRSRDRI